MTSTTLYAKYLLEKDLRGSSDCPEVVVWRWFMSTDTVQYHTVLDLLQCSWWCNG